MTPQTIFNAEFRDCAKSPEYKEGALRGLQKALGQAPTRPGVPYRAGTCQFDAWRAGFDAGVREGRYHLEQREQGGKA